jgi:hypothetical protein
MIREIYRYVYAKTVKQELDLKSFRVYTQLVNMKSENHGDVVVTYNIIPLLFGPDLQGLALTTAAHLEECEVLA